MNYAMVTGATSGIGLAIAEALLEDGCFVFLNYANNEKRAESIASKLAPHNGCFEFIRADMSGFDGAKIVTMSLYERGIKLNYLALSFGITDRTPFGEINMDDWESVMCANVSVPLFLIQNLYTANLFAKGASILCVSSLMASIPHSASVSYGVSKAALSALCKNLVKFLAPSEIRINAVEPAFIDTPWQKGKPSEQRARIEAKTALGRFGEPREVADICLATLNNTYLTGTIIQISGGYGLV